LTYLLLIYILSREENGKQNYLEVLILTYFFRQEDPRNIKRE